MSFSPTQFRSYIKGNNGMALSNRYRVNLGKYNNDKIPMMCHTAKILGKTINVNSQIYGFGSEYSLPINEGFEDLTLSFHCTQGKNKENGLPERRLFDEWMDSVINPYTNQSGWKDNYSSDITVELFDNAETPIYKQKFFEAFPIQISDLELTGTGSELLTFDVTFTFDNWLLVN